MKLAREDIIKACEKHLLKLIVKNIDKNALKQAVSQSCGITPGSDIYFYGGDIVAKDNNVAYRLDFSLQANLSLLLDRNGEALEIAASEKLPQEGELDGDKDSEHASQQIAQEIARMLSEINK
ncbi:MAG: hypothetical protein K9J85_03505 [Desulfobacteraceae bacterium]|nr:hypothetical protein [Desulfobacteraceae bacterium]